QVIYFDIYATKTNVLSEKPISIVPEFLDSNHTPTKGYNDSVESTK
ncbi:unnamed protein product, partial [Rotaria sp. Silwood1]